MKRVAWTPERTAELLALSATMPHKAVAAKLGLTLSQVENRVTRAKSDLAPARNEVPAFTPEPVAAPIQDRPKDRPNPAPAVHARSSNWLVIADAQIPFHKQGAVQFIERVRRNFSVPKENMLCAGDETDGYFGSRFDHTPDATHTPNSEIAAALDELRH